MTTEAGAASSASRLPPWRPLLREVARLAAEVVVWGLAGLCAAELLLRAAGLPSGATVRASDAYGFDGAGLGAYRPGAHLRMRWPPESAYDAHFNSWGGRGAEPRDGAPRVLALGDSNTFGLGVEDDELWTAQLDRILASEGEPAAVLNLGSPHLLIDDQLHYLGDALSRYAPEVVVYQVPSFGPGAYRPEGTPTPHRRSRERERDSRDLSSRLFDATAIDEARTFVYLWRERLAFEARGRYLRIPDQPRDADASGRAREHYERRLRELASRVEAAGAELLLAPLPDSSIQDGRVEFHPPWTVELAERMGLPYADVYAAYREAPDPAALLQLPHDLHPSPEGHRAIARAVAAELLRRGWLD